MLFAALCVMVLWVSYVKCIDWQVGRCGHLIQPCKPLLRQLREQ